MVVWVKAEIEFERSGIDRRRVCSEEKFVGASGGLDEGVWATDVGMGWEGE